MKIDRAVRKAEKGGDVGGGFAAGRPGQHLDLAPGEGGRRSSQPAGRAEAGLDDFGQQFKIDGLGDVVVGPQPAALEGGVAVGEGGEKEEGDRTQPVGVDPREGFQHFEPRHLRHGDVAEHEIGRIGEDAFQPLASVDRDLDPIAPPAEEVGQQFPGILVVLDAQDARAHGETPLVPGRIGRRTVKVAPSFSTLAAAMQPPCRRASFCAR